MNHFIETDDIWVQSSEGVQCQQLVDPTLNYENLNINAFDYTDYRPTRLQFRLTSPATRQSIRVKVNYANRLTPMQVKYAMVCHYDEPRRQWVVIKHQVNEENKSIDFSSPVTGSFCIFVNHYWYSSITQRLADEYPNWTTIRTKKESNGQLFLNYFGMELETIEAYLEWIQEQKYLATVDLQTFDWIYMYQLPVVEATDQLKVLQQAKDGSVQSIPILESLHSFFYNDQNKGGIFDYTDNRFYTAFSYGELIFQVTRNNQKQSYSLVPTDFPIWNALDEFALLVGLSRKRLEKNDAFKDRILDVFRYPSGTHDIGLTNGIARDLGLIHRTDRLGKSLQWEDDTKDLVLRNVTGKNVDIRTIRVDDQLLTSDQLSVDEVGNIRIHAWHTYNSHTISFISGVEKYQLYDRNKGSLYQMMFQANGQATPLMLRWVEYINTIAPVMWDRFTWDNGFWDTIDQQLTGLGFVPNSWDSHIDIWKDYTFESER